MFDNSSIWSKYPLGDVDISGEKKIKNFIDNYDKIKKNLEDNLHKNNKEIEFSLYRMKEKLNYNNLKELQEIAAITKVALIELHHCCHI
jgi:prophage maintenance system killer protein